MELPQPFGPAYQARIEESGEKGTECAICGRRTSGRRLRARVVDGGVRFAAPDADEDQGGDMGYFPVGTECAKLLPAGWAVR